MPKRLWNVWKNWVSKFPVTLNPKDEKEEEADFPISQGKTDENKKE